MVRLRVITPFDPWGSPLCTCPFKYSLNPYTGCSFRCLYCYATSYIGLRDSTPKRNFIRNLVHDVKTLPPGALINIGTSSDPYPPEENLFKLTRRALEVLVPLGFRVLITTKGVLVTRDVDIIARGNVAVTPTVTTLDERVARVIEPNAPKPLERVTAIEVLAREGVPVGVRVDPIIPYVNDDPYDIEELVCRLKDAGAVFIVTSTYKAKPDNLARMRRGLNELDNIGEKIYKLYKERGVKVGGYTYLPRELRESLLRPVIEASKRCGLEYATCREGFTGREWFNARSCDGSHLIPSRIHPSSRRMGAILDRWLEQ